MAITDVIVSKIKTRMKKAAQDKIAENNQLLKKRLEKEGANYIPWDYLCSVKYAEADANLEDELGVYLHVYLKANGILCYSVYYKKEDKACFETWLEAEQYLGEKFLLEEVQEE